MGTRRSDAEKRPHEPRLYLTAEAGSTAKPDAMAAALGEADVAAVLLRLPQRDDKDLRALIAAIAPIIQQHGSALLLDARADLVAASGVDGAHLTGTDAVLAALPELKPDRIVGAGGLASRHDAMLVAEAGADYVMFGEPDVNGHRPGLDAITERIAWWSEVFEPPCVGYAASLDEVALLARAGADFVALGDFVWNDARGAAGVVRLAGAQLRSLELT
jgi:thiamine-phosphate pyrophosphorylase